MSAYINHKISIFITDIKHISHAALIMKAYTLKHLLFIIFYIKCHAVYLMSS